MWKEFAVIGTLIAVPLAPLSAQSDSPSAEEAMERAKQVYGPPPPRRSCKSDRSKSDTGEDGIVVCAELEEDNSKFRVKSSSELDSTSRKALNDGRPRAPDVAGDGIFQGKGISLGGTPEPAYMFDLSELPEAPEGSDADLIAKGKKKAD
jgi:hypothetical protein